MVLSTIIRILSVAFLKRILEKKKQEERHSLERPPDIPGVGPGEYEMTSFLNNVPPHILVAFAVAMICTILEAIDTYSRPPAGDNRFGIMRHLIAQKRLSKAEISKNEKRKAFKRRVRLIRSRITVFSILFSVFAVNVDIIADMLFDVTLGWMQNALITIWPVAVLTYALERIIKMAPYE